MSSVGRYLCVSGEQIVVFVILLASVAMMMVGIFAPKHAYVFFPIGFGLILVDLGLLWIIGARREKDVRPMEIITYGSV